MARSQRPMRLFENFELFAMHHSKLIDGRQERTLVVISYFWNWK